MNTSLNSPSVKDSSERRLVLLWLLFLFTVILVSPSAFAKPDTDDEDVAPMSCGGMDCMPQSCESAPEIADLDVFIVPSENSTTTRSFTLLPVSLAVLYTCTEQSSLSVPVRSAPDAPLVFVPLHVMGPAHAAHAPPVA